MAVKKLLPAVAEFAPEVESFDQKFWNLRGALETEHELFKDIAVALEQAIEALDDRDPEWLQSRVEYAQELIKKIK